MLSGTWVCPERKRLRNQLSLTHCGRYCVLWPGYIREKTIWKSGAHGSFFIHSHSYNPKSIYCLSFSKILGFSMDHCSSYGWPRLAMVGSSLTYAYFICLLIYSAHIDTEVDNASSNLSQVLIFIWMFLFPALSQPFFHRSEMPGFLSHIDRTFST